MSTTMRGASRMWPPSPPTILVCASLISTWFALSISNGLWSALLIVLYHFFFFAWGRRITPPMEREDRSVASHAPLAAVLALPRAIVRAHGAPEYLSALVAIWLCGDWFLGGMVERPRFYDFGIWHRGHWTPVALFMSGSLFQWIAMRRWARESDRVRMLTLPSFGVLEPAWLTMVVGLLVFIALRDGAPFAGNLAFVIVSFYVGRTMCEGDRSDGDAMIGQSHPPPVGANLRSERPPWLPPRVRLFLAHGALMALGVAWALLYIDGYVEPKSWLFLGQGSAVGLVTWIAALLIQGAFNFATAEERAKRPSK